MKKGGSPMEKNNQNGAYSIQEQGDLGLGLTPIDEQYVDKNTGKINIPKDNNNGFTGNRNTGE